MVSWQWVIRDEADKATLASDPVDEVERAGLGTEAQPTAGAAATARRIGSRPIPRRR
jgi:hypothetical protein